MLFANVFCISRCNFARNKRKAIVILMFEIILTFHSCYNCEKKKKRYWTCAYLTFYTVQNNRCLRDEIFNVSRLLHTIRYIRALLADSTVVLTLDI